MRDDLRRAEGPVHGPWVRSAANGSNDGVAPAQTCVRCSTMTIEWMSTAEAADYLGVRTRTLYRFIDEGALAAYRFGRVIRLMRSDVESFLASCRIAGPSEAANPTAAIRSIAT